MTINQAFEILQKSGGIRAARIITDHFGPMTGIRVRRIARQLRRDVPVAKIIHEKWFYGIRFYTNTATLDPRPDTETLVSAVIKDCTLDAPRILDAGTGTGCIIGALAKNIPTMRGIGIDRSWGAVRVARKNMRRLGLVDRIDILWRGFATFCPDRRFDIVVTNPPYIAHGDTMVDAGARHDPAMALYARDNGLAAYKTIARRATQWLRPGGRIYMEIGIDQETPVREIFDHFGYKFVRSEQDLGGIIRVLIFDYS